MTERREHAVARPKVIFDGFRLAGVFDDDQLPQDFITAYAKGGVLDSLRQEPLDDLAAGMPLEPPGEFEFEQSH